MAGVLGHCPPVSLDHSIALDTVGIGMAGLQRSASFRELGLVCMVDLHRLVHEAPQIGTRESTAIERKISMRHSAPLKVEFVGASFVWWPVIFQSG